MNSPLTGSPMELRTRPETRFFRREPFQIVHHFYLCEETGEEFTDEHTDSVNQNQVLNQYRAAHNLPFPDEIAAIRTKYGLSASKMAEVLGFGINSYRQYETGEIPSDSNARLIQLAKDPEEFKKLICISGVLEEQEQEKLLSKIDQLIFEERRNKPVNWVSEYLFGSLRPSQYTGYRRPNVEKFVYMTMFFAEKTKPYKTKLNKLMFYADFLCFKRHQMSISGATYRAIQLGPVPNNYDALYAHGVKEDLYRVHYEEFDNRIGEQYCSCEHVAFRNELFSNEELAVLDEVVKRFYSARTSDIVGISHEERAWTDHEGQHEKIDYKYAFDLKAV
ncbi:hypothetical protein GCM10028808_39810 [Spirosoma migulaei]